MAIRPVKDTDYETLVMMYKKFFRVHNQFQQSPAEIVKYLKQQAKENLFLVSEDGAKLNGALILVREGQNADGSHTRWKYRHVVFQSDSVGTALLREAEERVRRASATAKVELTIAESEPGMAFYKARGYVQEGALKNHYRFGETCFILSKSFR